MEMWYCGKLEVWDYRENFKNIMLHYKIHKLFLLNLFS
jgi:hypothetical protein